MLLYLLFCPTWAGWQMEDDNTVGEPVKCIAPAWQYSTLWSPNEPEFLFCFGSDALSPTHHKCQEKQLTASEFFTWWIRIGVIAVVLYFYEVTIPLSTTISEISLHLRLFVNFHFISTKLFTDCTLWAIFHHRGEKKPEMSREIVWKVSCWSREEALVFTCVLSALRPDPTQNLTAG